MLCALVQHNILVLTDIVHHLLFQLTDVGFYIGFVLKHRLGKVNIHCFSLLNDLFHRTLWCISFLSLRLRCVILSSRRGFFVGFFFNPFVDRLETVIVCIIDIGMHCLQVTDVSFFFSLVLQCCEEERDLTTQ